MKGKIFAVPLVLACAATATAAVVYDENGVGFVGKGDVQSLYDWNNSMLQMHAGEVRFRMLMPGTASWECGGLNPGGNYVVQTRGEESDGIQSDINMDARRNRQGQVTGFLLKGLAGSPSYASVGICEPPNRQWTSYEFIEGSLVYEGAEDPLLQISIDGLAWDDLPITE